MPVDSFADLGFGGEQGGDSQAGSKLQFIKCDDVVRVRHCDEKHVVFAADGNDRQPYRPFPRQQLENFGIDLARGWLYHVDAELADRTECRISSVRKPSLMRQDPRRPLLTF